MDIPDQLLRLAQDLRQTKTAASSDDTKAIAKKALRLTNDYLKDIGVLAGRARSEYERLEDETEAKKPERFSDAEDAQWWMDTMAQEKSAEDLWKLLKDIQHEDLGASVTSVVELGLLLKN